MDTGRMVMKEVAEVMTRAVVAAGPTETVGEIRDLMRSNGLRSVPVLDATGHTMGVVSALDLIDGHADDDLIEAAMTNDVVAIGPENTVAQAATMMLANSVHHLVVVDDRMRALGVVSSFDLLEQIAELDQS